MKITSSRVERRQVFTVEGLIFQLDIEDELIIGVEGVTLIEKNGLTTTIPAVQVRYIISHSNSNKE